MKKSIFASTLALGAALLTAGAAHATTYEGGATFSDTGGSSNVSFSTSTASFGPTSLTAGTAGNSLSFYVNISGTVSDSKCSSGCTDNLNLDVTFSLPGSGSDSQNGTGTVDSHFLGFFYSDSGSINWGPGNYQEDTITFANGAKASVDIYDASLSGFNGSFTGNVQVVITDLLDPSPVPEPMSMALLGVGLAGVGMIRRRRRAG